MEKEKAVELYKQLGDCKEVRITPLWREAYQLYNQHSGKSVKLFCGSCACKVKNWLRSVCNS